MTLKKKGSMMGNVIIPGYPMLRTGQRLASEPSRVHVTRIKTEHMAGLASSVLVFSSADGKASTCLNSWPYEAKNSGMSESYFVGRRESQGYCMGEVSKQ